MNNKAKSFLVIFGAAFSLILLILLFIFGSNPYTPAGYEGYVYEEPRMFGDGGYMGELKGPSNFGISLWRNKVINVDMRPSTYAETFKILASDDLNVTIGFHAVMEIEPGTIKQMVEGYDGEQMYLRFIKKSYRTFVREAVQGYASKEIKENREKIAGTVKSKLETYLVGSPVIVRSVVVGNVDYPKVVNDAIEVKLAAKQRLEAKETERLIAQKDAEIKVEEAKGIAKAQGIINATLTSNYLQHEAINAQLKMASSPNHTTVYIPSGANGIPIVQTLK